MIEEATVDCYGEEEQLQGLLLDRLNDAEGNAIEAHVEACALCQRALERLTGERDERSLARRRSADLHDCFVPVDDLPHDREAEAASGRRRALKPVEARRRAGV